MSQDHARHRQSSHDHAAPGHASAAAHEQGGPQHGALDQAGDAMMRRLAGTEPGHEAYPPGTELWVHRALGYHHSAVYVGNGEVVQVKAEPKDGIGSLLRGKDHFTAHINRVSVAEFAKGDPVKIGPAGTAHDPHVAIERANAKVGSAWEYNPLTHNCQHFSSWCVTGHAVSPEANAIKHATEDVVHLPLKIAGGVEDAAENVFGAARRGIGGLLGHFA